jgi:uncharacterized protein
MMDSAMYHEGSRVLQDQFDSRRIADRLEQVTVQTSFDASDRAFIAWSVMFFLATADAGGRPDCSYKGGMPGFVRVLNDWTLAFPDYDGNGMFRSLGNIQVNPNVSLLFVDFTKPNRLRVVGRAAIHDNDPLIEEFAGAQMIVRVHADQIFPNCPRYVHKMELVEYSDYAPRLDHVPPTPGWKEMEVFRDALPARDLVNSRESDKAS